MKTKIKATMCRIYFKIFSNNLKLFWWNKFLFEEKLDWKSMFLAYTDDITDAMSMFLTDHNFETKNNNSSFHVVLWINLSVYLPWCFVGPQLWLVGCLAQTLWPSFGHSSYYCWSNSGPHLKTCTHTKTHTYNRLINTNNSFFTSKNSQFIL